MDDKFVNKFVAIMAPLLHFCLILPVTGAREPFLNYLQQSMGLDGLER